MRNEQKYFQQDIAQYKKILIPCERAKRLELIFSWVKSGILKQKHFEALVECIIEEEV